VSSIGGDLAFDKMLDRVVDLAGEQRLLKERHADQGGKLRQAQYELDRFRGNEMRAAQNEILKLKSRINVIEAKAKEAGIELPKEPAESDDIPF